MKFIKPISDFDWKKNVTQMFGVNKELYSTNFGIPGHNGIDIIGDNEKLGYGTIIKAAHDFDTASIETDFPLKTKGNGIRLFKHLAPQEQFIVEGKNCTMIETIYWHLADFDIKAGQSGKAGDIIGRMGNTGQVIPKPNNTCMICPYLGSHLHFGWRAYDKNGIIPTEYDGYRDPVPYLFEKGEQLPVSFSRDLYLGRSGDDVSQLQTILRIEGFAEDYEPTGFFWTKTMRDVIKFQNKYLISPAAGYVGTKTCTFLNTKY